jgi:7,8-dihydropterin-6-yl-methyl-4-(beta-D-ribofuranosyl)aminobenzene 5'-phosphate synthase
MKEDINITILIENTTHKASLKTEHGLSFWIEYGEKKVLFDTGQTESILYNAKILHIDLAKTDAILLSHGHYDHTGGLPAVLGIASKAKIYLHPAATEPKFSQKVSQVKYIGMPDSAKKAIQDRHIIWTSAPAQIFAGVSLTGQVLRLNDYEDVGGAFFADEDCQKSDELLDDQALFIESSKGLVVVLGCAHSGVVNTLDYISSLTGRNSIYAVIGGMHLLHANHKRIANTINAFQKYEVQKIVPLHCTGRKATMNLKNAFGNRCSFLSTGGQIIFSGD